MADVSTIEVEELEDYFSYLDKLRESGVTNMYGATPYVQDAFDLKRGDAETVLSAWMRTFSHDETAYQRALKAATPEKGE